MVLQYFAPIILTVTSLIYLPNNDARFSFIFHPYHILAFIAAYILSSFASQQSQKSTKTYPNVQRKFQYWFLLNGLGVHLVLNGLQHLTTILPTVLHRFELTNIGEYFTTPYYLHQSTLWDALQMTNQQQEQNINHNNNVVLSIIKLIELFILFPLCCALFVGYETRPSWRAPLQIVVTTAQIVIFIIYATTSVLNVPSIIDNLLATVNTESQIDYVVAFTCALAPISIMILWIVLPLQGLYNAFQELTTMIEINLPSTIPLDSKTFVFAPQAFNKSRPSNLPTTPGQLQNDDDVEYTYTDAATNSVYVLRPQQNNEQFPQKVLIGSSPSNIVNMEHIPGIGDYGQHTEDVSGYNMHQSQVDLYAQQQQQQQDYTFSTDEFTTPNKQPRSRKLRRTPQYQPTPIENVIGQPYELSEVPQSVTSSAKRRRASSRSRGYNQ